MTDTSGLRLDGVSLRLGMTEVLRDVNLAVTAGELVALIGPSGAGKSSLISVANATVLPTEGVVHLFPR